MLHTTQEGLLILVVIRSHGVTAHMIHVMWLEASRDFGDGYFVNVCVSLSFLDGAAKPSYELFSLFQGGGCSWWTDLYLTLLQTSLALGSTS